MKVRFGFVAMTLSLTNASPSQTMTFKTFKSIPDRTAALEKATRIAESNLENTLRILRHTHSSGVHVYRFTSKLIPLFGHDETVDWDFIERLQNPFRKIGDFVRTHQLRVSFHPDHFTLLNAPKEDITSRSIKDLVNHVRIFEAMGLDENAKFVIHVGGGYKDKQTSIKRFETNWSLVPKKVQERLTLENDDKTYTAKETQGLCSILGIPNVLDVHHHHCNHEVDSSLEDVVYPFLKSWGSRLLPPKAHMSSAKNEKDFRAHADFIRPNDLLPFLDIVRDYNQDIDIMLEAKQKDEAVFQLMKDLNSYNFIKIVDGGTIEYRP